MTDVRARLDSACLIAIGALEDAVGMQAGIEPSERRIVSVRCKAATVLLQTWAKVQPVAKLPGQDAPPQLPGQDAPPQLPGQDAPPQLPEGDKLERIGALLDDPPEPIRKLLQEHGWGKEETE